MAGGMTLEGGEAGPALVIPSDTGARFAGVPDDLEILEVSLPGVFETRTE
jgi:hypothetical protein